MRMRNGFTLIEITIVVAISGIMLALLYQTYGNVLRSRTRIASRVGYVTHMPLVYQQLARDITGMYIPAPAIADLFAESEEQRSQKIRVNTACVLLQTDEQMTTFTGITSNPMTLEYTPNRVRFVYNLVTQEDGQAAILYRYQTSDLTKTADDVIKEQDGVKLLDGITLMRVTLYAPEQQEQQQQEQQKQQEQQSGTQQQGNQQQTGEQQEGEQVITYASYTAWPMSDEQRPAYLLPTYAQIELQGIDAYERRFEEAFTFAVAAYDGVQNIYANKKQEAEQQQKQAQQRQQGQQAQGKQQQSQAQQQSAPQAQQKRSTALQDGGGERGQQQQTMVRRIQLPQRQQQKRIYLVPRNQYEQTAA